MRSYSFNIGKRLLLGFGIVVILTTLFGVVVLDQFRTLSSFTEDMHKHPMAVSNSVRNIQTSVAKIRYILLRYAGSDNEEDLQVMFRDINSLQGKIEEDFDIIKERFLGDMTDVNRAYKTFSEVDSLLDSVLSITLTGKQDEAKNLTSDTNLDYMLESLSDQLVIMSHFASGKSTEFYNNALESSSSIFRTTIMFLIITMVICLLVGTLISMSITKPLGRLIELVQKMAVGDNESHIEIINSDEIGRLSLSLNEMQDNLQQVVSHAGKIAEGDYSGYIAPRSEKDRLAISLNSMTQSLNQLKESNDYQDWMKSGQNLLSSEMRGDLGIRELATTVITALSQYVEAQVGVLYLYNSDRKELRLTGSYAYSMRKGLNSRYQLGEGIAGQAALEKKLISVINAPEDYMRISSGLGDSRPANIVAFPMLFNSELKGIIELGAFRVWDSREIDFFNSVSEMIGVSFNSSETRNSLNEMVEHQQEQAKELKATNEELEEKTERLVQSEERLKTQQEELRATNEELEEKTEHLEHQRDEINRKNMELQIVQEEIIQKAEDLENSSRYKSEFLANMSHELRTPLNSLLILAKDLMNNKGDRLSEDDVQSAEIIYNSGNELLLLINEILDLAKIESGKMTLSHQEISIDELRNNMGDLFASIAGNKGLELVMETSSDCPSRIVTDRQKIGQILKNLLSNAFKFTSEGKVSIHFGRPERKHLVKLKGSYKGELVLIQVSDTGIGIPEDMQNAVFDAFKQVDGSSSREFGGTGLGLSISRELASLLGGEILLQSQEGKGSTFSLIIPRILESVGEIERNLPPEPVVESESLQFPVIDDRDVLDEGDRTILIVEDDRNFAAVLKRYCSEMAFKCLISHTGESGVSLADKYKPDAVILDIKLPGMNGLQVLDHLKKNKATRHIPVHMMSVEDMKDQVLDRGVLGFLQKPIEKESLEKMFGELQDFMDKKVKDLLIVEDNENLRKSIEKLIGNNDVAKTSVASGSEALAALSEKKFDCMILDLSLPDFSGFELLQKMETLDLPAKPPVVIYTGREISYEEELELRKYTSSVIVKGVHSEERLLDETALFLHRVIDDLPEQKQNLISRVYNQELVFKDKNVLVVDDDMRNLYAVAKILEEQGVNVLKAVDGQKALDQLEKEGDKVDLVLMDIMMPVLDGYETMKAIRKEDRYHSLPILALTAKAMKEDRAKCLEAGANDYMVKPIDPERLLSLMRVWLYK